MTEDLSGNPLDVLARWVAEAARTDLPLPHAMALATAGADGVPHARTVLMTGIDGTSLRFHSSTPTSKTRDLADNPRASAVFHWPSLGRQAIAEGPTDELDADVSLAAFRELSRQLQLLAVAYDALLPELSGPDFAVEPGAVERAFDVAARRSPDAPDMPPSWTTIRLVPHRMDFWQAAEDAPPVKTRFVAEPGDSWRHFPVLP